MCKVIAVSNQKGGVGKTVSCVNLGIGLVQECPRVKCYEQCKQFEALICNKLKKSPYVCNGCLQRQSCKLEKHIYSAKTAQKAYETTRSESRQGIAITPEELKRVDAIVSPLVKLGQSIHMICVNNTDDIMLDEKTIYNYIDGGLTSSIKYEYLYRLNALEEGMPEQGEALFQNYYEVEGNTVQLSVQGISRDSKYFPDKTDSGDVLDLDKYYLTSAAAQTYGIKAGDTLIFSNIADLKEHKVTISGIVTDNTHCYLYTGRENATALAGVDSDAYNCIISRDALSLDKDRVASETTMTVTADTMENMMGPMHTIIVIFEIIGVVLGVFVLYLIINMIVAETATNISVMKVLGFSQKEISNRVLNVNHILVCIGYLIGIPAAYIFVRIGYADSIENYGMLMSPVLTARTLVIGFVLTWAVYEISILLQKKKISRIDMVEALKENNRNE